MKVHSRPKIVGKQMKPSITSEKHNSAIKIEENEETAKIQKYSNNDLRKNGLTKPDEIKPIRSSSKIEVHLQRVIIRKPKPSHQSIQRKSRVDERINLPSIQGIQEGRSKNTVKVEILINEKINRELISTMLDSSRKQHMEMERARKFDLVSERKLNLMGLNFQSKRQKSSRIINFDSANPSEIHSNQSSEGKRFINELFRTIERQNAQFGLLSPSIFKKMEEDFNGIYYSIPQQQNVAKQLLIYMRLCSIRNNPETRAQKNNLFFKLFGERMLRTQNQVFFGNKNMLRIVSYLGESSQKYGCYLDLKGELNVQEAVKVAGKTRELYKYDERAFFFLSNYLYQSCFNLEQLGKDLPQIEGSLKNVLDQIRKAYPPAPPIQKKHKIEIQIPDIIAKEKEYEEYIDFAEVPLWERKKEMEKFIMQRAQEAISSKGKFVELIEEICREKGSHFKLGVKVKDKDHLAAIQRVQEKLIDKTFKKYSMEEYLSKTEPERRSLQNFIQKEKDHFESQMIILFKKIDKPLCFSVTDMLRAKCLFLTVEQIQKCAEKLISKMQQQNIQLIQFDNRLNSKTSDLVLKILINKTVAELQLSIEFNAAENEFNHKIYEIVRSKFNSTLKILEIMTITTGSELLPELKECFATFSKISHEEQRDIFEMNDTFRSLSGRFDTFMKKVAKLPYNKTEESFELQNQQFQLKKIMRDSEGFASPNAQKNVINRNSAQFYQGMRKYQSAIQEFNQFLTVLQMLPEGSKIAQIQKLKTNRQIGFMLDSRGKLKQALQYYQKSITFVENESMANNTNLIYIYDKIGQTYQKLAQYDKSLDYYNKIIEGNSYSQDNSSYSYAAVLNNMGKVYQKKKNNQESLNCYFKSLSIIERLKGKQAVECTPVLTNIGTIYLNLSKYSEALKYFSRSLQIREKAKGKEDFQCAQTLNNIGIVYFNQKRFDEAKRCYEDSLQIRERIVGKDDIECIDPLNNLGRLYIKLKNSQKALEYHKKCVEIQEKVLGRNHISCAVSINRLSFVFVDQEKYAQALQLKRQVRQVYVKRFGETSKEVRLMDKQIQNICSKI